MGPFQGKEREVCVWNRMEALLRRIRKDWSGEGGGLKKTERGEGELFNQDGGGEWSTSLNFWKLTKGEIKFRAIEEIGEKRLCATTRRRETGDNYHSEGR